MKPPVFSCLASHTTTTGSLYGRFLFGPLPIDISLTLATIVRRSLLHSKPPFVIVSAEIEGAIHEYAALPGIQESVLEILLNLGEIVLTSKKRNLLNSNFRVPICDKFIANTEIYIASLRISGPCIVTAKDINWPEGIYCVKPSTHIATLSNNNTLAMRIKIVSSHKNKNSLFQTAVAKQTKNVMDTKKDIKMHPTHFSTLFQYKSRWRPAMSSFVKPNSVDSSLYAWSLIPDMNEQKVMSEAKYWYQKRISNKYPAYKFDQRNIKSELLCQQNKNKKFIDIRNYSKYALPLQYKSKYSSKLNMHDYLRNIPLLVKPSNGYYNEVKKSRLQQEKFSFLGFWPIRDKKKYKKHLSFAQIMELLASAKSYITPLKNQFVSTKSSFDRELPISMNDILSGDFESQAQKSSSLKSKFIDLNVESSFYCVEKVNFVIERDDQLVGYRHRIIFEVWTNGSISPRQAIFDSISWIILLLYNFRESSSPLELSS